jgi:glycine/D-amino acid oxidase-like deaminating enzyme
MLTKDTDTLFTNISESPPQHVDYAVIGSGISGALIAYDLVKTLPIDTTIVILDARHAVSGATGRNGGHIKPGRIASFEEYQRKYGAELALEQIGFEKANYEDLTHFIQQENLDKECDLVLLEAVDVCMNEESLDQIKRCWEKMLAAGADMSDMQYHNASYTAEVIISLFWKPTLTRDRNFGSQLP